MGSISVIIPSWNDAALLEKCLAALAAQTRPADEVIVVDNASTDATADVARSFGARVVTEPVRGILRATSTGFDAASGEILARLDADSVPPHDWLERVEVHLDKARHPAAVSGPGEFYGAGPVLCWLGRVVYIGGYFWSMGLLLGHPPLFGSNFALHSQVWATVGGKVHREVRAIHDDLDLSLQLEPGVTIVYDGQLRVGISARPFDTFGGLVRRMYWAWTTLSINAREQSLLRRRARWRRRSSA